MSRQLTTGQDSFLDIVANLVGILIILVVVVGAQARHQLVQVTPDETIEAQIAELRQQQDREQLAARKVELDNQETERRIIEQNRLAAELTDRRHRLLVQLEVMKQAADAEREKLAAALANADESRQQQLLALTEYQQKKQKLSQSLGAVQQAIYATDAYAAEASSPDRETIEHYPNPIAKTVFSEEIHFRLQDGKLAYVPMDELISLMKSEWKVKAEKLQQSQRTLETIGPIAGFRMQYQLGAETVLERTELGDMQRRAVQFQKFQIVPQPGLQGESLDKAFTAGSQFQQRLEGREPARTTVSVWLYPDGYADHARLKNWLHENGFRMSSWPLEFGRPISGGPNGFKTSAQ